MALLDKQHALDAIAVEIESCRICKQFGIGKAVPGEGNPDASVIFVGEAPGKQEASTGRPFVGRSGNLLRKMIRSIGLKESEVYITSPVKYLPISKTPKPADIMHSKIHLDKQLAIIDPSIIVLLGATAIAAVLGEKLPVLQYHGKVIEKGQKKYLIMLHPAAVLRVPGRLPAFESDFRALKELMNS